MKHSEDYNQNEIAAMLVGYIITLVLFVAAVFTVYLIIK